MHGCGRTIGWHIAFGGTIWRADVDILHPGRCLIFQNCALQREIGGSLWLLLLTFYSIYYGAYMYLVYKILQSLPGECLQVAA
jgi:hypothetical protein